MLSQACPSAHKGKGNDPLEGMGVYVQLVWVYAMPLRNKNIRCRHVIL